MNGHMAMFLKMFGVGSRWQHQDRFRESTMHKSLDVPVMSLLLKDHKKVEVGALPKTWPVVGANRGLNMPLSDVISDILEPMSRVVAGTMR